MKAEAIRDQNEPVRNLLKDAESGQESVGYMTILVLSEIAAQLSELNENLQQVIGHEKVYNGGLVGGVRIIEKF